MPSTLLTKQLKSDWLNELKSGKYEQFGGDLKNTKKDNSYCCLGVLVLLMPEVSINESGTRCIVDGKEAFYKPIDALGKAVANLAITNDISYGAGVRDFSVVIPLIEKLETID